MFSSKLRWAALALLPAAGLVLSGCGAGGGAGASDDGRLSVVTAFYPLEYAASRVAGDHANVTNLTKAGSEPHDLELTPKDGAAIEEASLVVYLKGFQPAVDESIAQGGKEHSFDVTPAAELLPLAEEPGHEDAGHEEGGEEHESEMPGGTDPHFWLDPVRYAKVVDAIGAQLASVDPDHASDYRANAKALHGELDKLNSEFRTGLASCANKDLVTSHEAFGYLAARYGLEQIGIAGLSPDQEPSPAKQAEVAKFVRDHEVHTIYYETLVNPDVAKSLADETGAKVDVLDPLEGITDQSKGKDYPSVMQANLDALQKGQPCT
ncbi:metal ABC transporter substrate-binding protein [Flindersiella endophytica]